METPVTTLANQIKVFVDFIADLDKRKNVPSIVTNEQIEISKQKYRDRVVEFEKAIEILIENSTCVKCIPMQYGQLTICETCNRIL